MKQASLKIKSYAGNMGNIQIVDSGNLQRRIFQLLLASFAALAVSYILILGSMTFNIVERKSLETEARALSNEVVNLELTYLDISNKIDLNLAASLGFKETKASFATRKSLGSIKFAKNDL